MKYSFVIISRNEESNIEKCLNSVYEGVPNNEEFEVIIVDSASNDNTIMNAITFFKKINLKYKIISIYEASQYSAALGRYIGGKEAVGEVVVFLDGDMTLDKNFLREADNYLKSEKNLGVIGKRDDWFYNRDQFLSYKKKDVYQIGNEVKSAAHFGGALVIKKEVILKTGGYNYGILASEEPEFYLRIKNTYPEQEILQIPVKMIEHHINKVEETTLFQKWFYKIGVNKRSKGLGQTFKMALKDYKVFKIMLKHKPIRVFLLPYILIFMLLISLLLMLKDIYSFFYVVLGLIILTIFIEKNIKKFVYVFINYFYITTGLFENNKVRFKYEIIGEKSELFSR